MDTVYTIASVLAIMFVLAEMTAGVILFRRRREIGPRLRSLLGIDEVNTRIVGNALDLHRLLERQERTERKINYVGRHVKFEREQLRRMGILKDEASRMSEAPRATERVMGQGGTVHTFPRLTE